jgi:hypothetical protein
MSGAAGLWDDSSGSNIAFVFSPVGCSKKIATPMTVITIQLCRRVGIFLLLRSKFCRESMDHLCVFGLTVFVFSIELNLAWVFFILELKTMY